MDLAAVATDLAPTGTLRASINLGNPVLAQGTHAEPGGVTVDLARELATRLSVRLELLTFDAAKDSYAAMAEGRADLCFLAVDPAREKEVAFTAPYVVIQGVYAVPAGSPVETIDDVDREGTTVGVKDGSAYDLHLTRTLQHAEIVRGSDHTTAFEERRVDVAAGIRGPLTEYADGNGLRVLEPHFMEIRQAVGTTKDRHDDTVRWLGDVVEELKANGFVAAALERSGRSDAVVAPPRT